ncbi:MAG TPA: glutathione S-transferase N-terminal domain-containing protein [Candidatus Binatia bacterium]|jgi:GST-like protein
MIDVYAWATMNARKIYIMLEETGLPYRIRPVNITKGEQFKPEFLAISPNNKTPAIIDRDGPGGGDYSLFESGAILMYLADKTGRLLPADPAARSTVIQWLMWQMGGPGPMFTEAHHFHSQKNTPDMAYPAERYDKESYRLLKVAEKRLGESKYLAGDFLTKLTYSSRCGHDARAGIKSSKITYQLCLTDPTLALGLLRIPDQKRRQHQRHQNKHRDLEGTVVDCRTGHAKVRDRLHNHAK